MTAWYEKHIDPMIRLASGCRGQNALSMLGGLVYYSGKQALNKGD
jgi:hypothetical protein